MSELVVRIGALLALIVAQIAFSNSAVAQTCTSFGESEFFRSATAEKIVDCINGGASINQRSENGETPLHWAAGYSSDIEVLDILLREGADPAIKRNDGMLPIHMAAKFGNTPPVITSLVFAGADIDALFDVKDLLGPDWLRVAGTTALIEASKRKDGTSMVAALLAAGANTEYYDRTGRTALSRAVFEATDAQRTKLLLVAGSDVAEQDYNDWTALHIAASSSPSSDVIRALLASGANPDAKGPENVTPLSQAAANSKNSEVLGLLLSKSKSPCKQDKKGGSALIYAEDNAAIKGSESYWKLVQACRN